jgi:hypothetical protein
MPNREDRFLPSLNSSGVWAQTRTLRPSGLGSRPQDQPPCVIANEYNTTTRRVSQGKEASRRKMRLVYGSSERTPGGVWLLLARLSDWFGL